MPFAYDIETFAGDYFEARSKFLKACAERPGGRRREFPHPTARCGDRPLSTDVYWLGPENADRVLVTISATHGAEGFCGSAAQINWLRHETAPDDVALLFIHALNPYGFAHWCRVNE
ncbi:MAG: DUF2817 domain-containing protein, partial [Gammaproteobacteria bacterium]